MRRRRFVFWKLKLLLYWRKMKKFLATILTLVYLSSSMGATLHLHYCMGKFIGWGLVGNDSKNCSFCGMAKIPRPADCTVAKEGCCRDELKQLLTDQDQKQALSLFKFLKLAADQPLFNQSGQSLVLQLVPSIEFPNNNAPPLGDNVAIFLRNCNFRI